MFLGVEMVSTLRLYAQETTTALLWSHSCFPNPLVILNEDIILSNDGKMDRALGDWGPFLESPGNFSGPKSNIQIEI